MKSGLSRLNAVSAMLCICCFNYRLEEASSLLVKLHKLVTDASSCAIIYSVEFMLSLDSKQIDTAK